jgi:hypothetical protein
MLGRHDEPERPGLAEQAQVLRREGSLTIDALRLGADALLGGLTDRAEDCPNIVGRDNGPFGR